jgi:hypothetical protein
VWLVEHHDELGAADAEHFSFQFLDMMRGALGPH